MDLEIMKEHAQTWYGRIAQFLLFENVMMYLFACIVAHDVVGLTGYIAFLDHCCQWKGQ